MTSDAKRRAARRRVIAEWRRGSEPRDTSRYLHSSGELVPAVLRRLGIDRRMAEERLLAAWGDVVGEFIGRHSRPVRLDRKTLVVAVAQPAVLYTLETSLKRQVVGKLQATFGEQVVRNVRFVHG
jgi:predicted nucleic acid-binding Zn ribbon protein